MPRASALPRSLPISTHHGGFCLGGEGGGFGLAQIGTATRPIGKMPHAQPPEPLLRDRRSSSLEQAQNSYQRGVRRHLLTPEPREPPGPFEPKETAAVRSDGPY